MARVTFEPAERFPTTCYKLHSVVYVPHYKQNGFAYPGIEKNDPPLSEYALIAMGARKVTEMLYDALARGEKK
jgi:hypothetical protein